MSNGSSGEILRQFRTLFEAGAVGRLHDGQLLDRFADRRDEAAFAALVERHGPMVLRVCLGVLNDEHEAQDAFQATFLVLARKAGSIRKRESVGPWLHGVACRVSARSKARAARRRALDRRFAEREDPRSAHEPDPSWMWAELHEEVDRLPYRYRAAVVLCYLEGLSNEEAAGRLRWPVGTVKVRLSRARERLRTRLTRRGLAPTVGLLVAASASDAMSAMPATLVELTVRSATGRATTGVVAASALSLTEGALRTMMLAKLKVVALGMLSIAAVTVGAGAILGQDDAKPGPEPATASGKAAQVVAPNGEDIEAIKKRMIDSVRRNLDMDRRLHDEGRITTRRLLDTMERYLAAEQQVAATKQERRAALEAFIANAERLLRAQQEQLKKGESTAEDVSEIQARIDSARLRLVEDSTAASPTDPGADAKSLPGAMPEAEALKKSLLDDARQILDDTYRRFNGGVVDVLQLLNAAEQTLEAELLAATTDADHRAVLKYQVQRLERILRDVEAQHKADRATRSDVTAVRARLAAAKLRLLEEPAGSRAGEALRDSKASTVTTADQELEKLQGTWMQIALEENGEEIAPDKEMRLIIADRTIIAARTSGPEPRSDVVRIQLDPTQTPGEIDLIALEGPRKDKPQQGIYRLDGNILQLCLDLSGRGRPSEFDTKPRSAHRLIVLRRPKPARKPIETPAHNAPPNP